MTRRRSVDSKSYDLAHAFLSEIRGATDDDIRRLAENLQQCCEDACTEVEEREGEKA
jgi:hypothetical protein